MVTGLQVFDGSPDFFHYASCFMTQDDGSESGQGAIDHTEVRVTDTTIFYIHKHFIAPRIVDHYIVADPDGFTHFVKDSGFHFLEIRIGTLVKPRTLEECT